MESAIHLLNNWGVMYQEFVVCNVPRNGITNVENSTILYFKSVSTWQEDLLRMHEAHKESWDMTWGLYYCFQDTIKFPSRIIFKNNIFTYHKRVLQSSVVNKRNHMGEENSNYRKAELGYHRYAVTSNQAPDALSIKL